MDFVGCVRLRSLHTAESVLESGDDVDYGAVPKGRRWFVVPLRMRGVEDCVIPIESTAQAADGFYLRRISRDSSIQLLGDKMVGVPKLPGSLVRDSAEGAAAGRSEIRGQDWLPDDQNAQLRI